MTETLKIMFYLLLFIVTVVECQLNFKVEQRLDELNLQCQVSGTNILNNINIGKLVISKHSGRFLEALATVSVHHSHNEPVSALSNAYVTGHVSQNTSVTPNLRIQWTNIDDGLNGNYTCQAYDVNNNLISSKQAYIKVIPTGPRFVATPSVIHVGLTKRLDISCSVPDPVSLNVSKVGSIEIFKIQNGCQCLFARIRSTSGEAFTTGRIGANVSGSIDRNNGDFVISWNNPTSDLAGEYICEVSVIGNQGNPVFFTKGINITWETPDQELLIRRLSEMTKRHEKLTEVEQEEEHLLEEAVQILNTTEKSQCRNPTSCDDVYFSLSPGQHIVRVEPEDGLGPITVLCDVIGRREIYTVFQKRFNGNVDFYRNFADYEEGFGSVDDEFWLGLKNIRRLVVQTGDKNQLRVDMTVKGAGINYTRIYPTFSIGPGDGYRLTVSGLYDRGFGMSSNSFKSFSTYDRGLKDIANKNNRGAGWWFPEDLGYVNLNGVWG